MKEFDFDELDRAVTSVLEEKKQEQGAGEGVREDSESRTEASSRQRISSRNIHSRTMSSARPTPPRQEERPADDTLRLVSPDKIQDDEAAASRESTAALMRSRSLVQRRSGRFMDVVHPSSDMKTASMGVARKAKAIVPPSEKIVAKPATDLIDDTSTPSDEPAATIEPKVTEDNPTDVASHKEEPQEATLKNDSEFDFESLLEQSEVPQSHPFLEGAQVEKRPLGGRSTIAVTDDSKEEELTPAVEEFTKTPDDEMPEDLSEKIEAIEAVQLDKEVQAPGVILPVGEVDETPAPVETIDSLEESTPLDDVNGVKSVEKEDDVKGEEAEALQEKTSIEPEPETKGEVATSAPESAGPTSIVRQYKETPRVVSEDDTSPIFDPENYSQPLEAEQEKSSAWGWIVGVLIALILVAALVAFLWWSGLLAIVL